MFGVTQERMRTMHDGIMIGIGTAVSDNPQLNGVYLVIISGAVRPHRLMIRFGSPSSPISGTEHAFPALLPPASSHSRPTSSTFTHV